MEPSKQQQQQQQQNPQIASYGFQAVAPPAYEQHSNFPQQPHSIPQGQVFQVAHGHPGPHVPQTQVVTVITNRFGPDPMPMQCPSCHHQIQTRIDYETSTKTHLFAGLICLLFWPCVWIPYVTDSCKNANHYCPACGCYLGRYSE